MHGRSSILALQRNLDLDLDLEGALVYAAAAILNTKYERKSAVDTMHICRTCPRGKDKIVLTALMLDKLSVCSFVIPSSARR